MCMIFMSVFGTWIHYTLSEGHSNNQTFIVLEHHANPFGQLAVRN